MYEIEVTTGKPRASGDDPEDNSKGQVEVT